MTRIILILAAFLSNLIIAAEIEIHEAPTTRFTVTYHQLCLQDVNKICIRTEITYAINDQKYRTKYVPGYVDEITEGLCDLFEFDQNVDLRLKAQVTSFFERTNLSSFMQFTITHIYL